MEVLSNGDVLLERELSDLDLEVIKFIRIVEKYVSYVLISGYTAIIFGRSRTTEDVDLFIEVCSKEKFGLFYKELLSAGYWALNADSVEELYSMLRDSLAIRFAQKGCVIPNFEVKFV